MSRESARFPNFEFLISIFVLSALFGGCASPGEPVERKPRVPQAIADLAATQSGNDVILTFMLPKETMDRRPLLQPPAIEIYRDFEPAPAAGAPVPGAPANPSLLVTIPSAMVDHYADEGHIRILDSLKDEDLAQHPGSIAVYTVRTRASTKKASPDSNVAALRIYPAPEAIDDLKAEVTHSAIVLTWSPPQKTPVGPAPLIAGYRIFRAEAEPGDENAGAAAVGAEKPKVKLPLAKIGESDSATYRDTQFEFGKTYIYAVRSLAQYPGETLESADSNRLAVTPRDIFPPAAPQGLVVVFVPGVAETSAHLELSWAISPETDIAGYNVYRSEQASIPGARLNAELLLTPAFRDMNTVPGRPYFYTVTAVDRSGNESPASAVVSGGIPAESQPAP